MALQTDKLDPRLAEALATLVAGLRRLAPTQGRIARRNARRVVAGAVRGLRAAVDGLYPLQARPAAKAAEPRRRRTPVEVERAAAAKRAARKRTLRTRGWVCLERNELLTHRASHVIAAMLTAGVRAVQVGDETWVPGWVMVAWQRAADYEEARATMRKLKNDPPGQQALLAVGALAKGV